MFLFSQNVKLPSLIKIRKHIKKGDKITFFTTHHLFENEIEFLRNEFGLFEYITFSMFLGDSEQEAIDKAADNENVHNTFDYYNQVRLIKNQRIAEKVCQKYKDAEKFIISNDLGIEESVWLKNGFKKVKCEYYYNWGERKSLKKRIKNIVKKIPFLVAIYQKIKNTTISPYGDDVYTAEWNGKTILSEIGM